MKILLIIFTFLTLIYSLNFNKDFLLDTTTPTLYVKEVTSPSQLKEYLNNNKKCFVELYSPSCPHCIDFAPKYELLATIYKDKINFVKVDATDYSLYRNFAKINQFPTLFLHDNEKLFEYKGKLEVDHVHEFIENVFYFKCKKIENETTLINFLKDNIKNSYVIGIFEKEDENLINFFNHINLENRMLVENCFYYIKRENFNSNLPYVYNLPNLENFIISYNQNIFNYFKLNLNHDKNFDRIISEKYHGFILEYFFPVYEKFDEFKLNSIISRGKDLLIFSYQNEKEKFLMENIINEYSIVNSENIYTIILYPITSQDNNIFSYFNFSKNPGIYISDLEFKRIKGIDDQNEFDIKSVINLVDEYSGKYKSKNDSNNSVKIKKGTKDNQNSESKSKFTEQNVKYVSAKIVESVDKIKTSNNSNNDADNLENKNSTEIAIKIIENLSNKNNTDTSTIINKENSYNLLLLQKFTIYIPIYSIIFYIIYKKVIANRFDITKEY